MLNVQYKQMANISNVLSIFSGCKEHMLNICSVLLLIKYVFGLSLSCHYFCYLSRKQIQQQNLKINRKLGCRMTGVLF